eukprot:scaffold28305_cov27-Tisochrysis_lutea.AAC.4
MTSYPSRWPPTKRQFGAGARFAGPMSSLHRGHPCAAEGMGGGGSVRHPLSGTAIREVGCSSDTLLRALVARPGNLLSRGQLVRRRASGCVRGYYASQKTTEAGVRRLTWWRQWFHEAPCR